MFSAPAIVASCCVSGYTSWFVYALFSSKAQFKTFSLCSIMKSLITFQYREALIISCAKSSMIVSGEITCVRFSHDGKCWWQGKWNWRSHFHSQSLPLSKLCLVWTKQPRTWFAVLVALGCATEHVTLNSLCRSAAVGAERVKGPIHTDN